MKLSFFIERILWVDCIGAICTGLAMLLLRGWISEIYGISESLVTGHAMVHLLYGSYSFSLAIRKHRPMGMLLLLIFANAGWACFCFVFAAFWLANVSIFVATNLFVEGIYVGGLALVEWHRREILKADN